MNDEKENTSCVKLEMMNNMKENTRYVTYLKRERIEERTNEYRLSQKKDGTLCLQRAFIMYENMWGGEGEIIWRDVETVKEQSDD